MGANFSPEFLNYNNKGTFVFWAQKVIPLVYDNSLSYYETLCKVVDYLNNVIENVETTEDNLNALKEAYDLLQGYVNTYFDNLDVQEEINNKLDELVAQGYFANFFTNFVTPEQYGAVGDGITDDTVAITAAINTGKAVVFANGATYIVTELPSYWGMRLYGNGCTLKRPNLKVAPYNWTDNQIKWSRFFDMRTSIIGAVVDRVTVFDGITFDGNAFEMWTETDGYKYEQAPFVAFAATRSGIRAQVAFTNCKFVDNFASGVSVSENIDIQMSDCFARDCFKGIITVVGQNCIVNMNNIINKNNYDTFQTINMEINHPDQPSTNEMPTFMNITNAYLEKNVKFGYSYNGSIVNITNATMRDMKGAIIQTGGVLNIKNSRMELTSTNTSTADNVFSIYGSGEINFDGCVVESVSSTQPLTLSSIAQNLSVSFRDTIFANSSPAFACISHSLTNNLSFDGCNFVTTGDVVTTRGSNTNVSLRKLTFSNCIFDTPEYIVNIIGSNENYPGFPVVFDGENMFVNSDCKGLRFYGKQKDAVIYATQFLRTNYGTAITTYSGSANRPALLGARYRYVTADPNTLTSEDIGVFYKGVDYAVLQQPPHTVWRYNGISWIEE